MRLLQSELDKKKTVSFEVTLFHPKFPFCVLQDIISLLICRNAVVTQKQNFALNRWLNFREYPLNLANSDCWSLTFASVKLSWRLVWTGGLHQPVTFSMFICVTVLYQDRPHPEQTLLTKLQEPKLLNRKSDQFQSKDNPVS